mmetsp:Transcript_7806/g.24356  ORF Transcript_7806/g.24356 Transcript_7806/m.24356 type:complete len:266 (+) Transcript_7806:998-1795(+)
MAHRRRILRAWLKDDALPTARETRLHMVHRCLAMSRIITSSVFVVEPASSHHRANAFLHCDVLNARGRNERMAIKMKSTDNLPRELAVMRVWRDTALSHRLLLPHHVHRHHTGGCAIGHSTLRLLVVELGILRWLYPHPTGATPASATRMLGVRRRRHWMRRHATHVVTCPVLGVRAAAGHATAWAAIHAHLLLSILVLHKPPLLPSSRLAAAVGRWISARLHTGDAARRRVAILSYLCVGAVVTPTKLAAALISIAIVASGAGV